MKYRYHLKKSDLFSFAVTFTGRYYDLRKRILFSFLILVGYSRLTGYVKPQFQPVWIFICLLFAVLNVWGIREWKSYRQVTRQMGDWELTLEIRDGKLLCTGRSRMEIPAARVTKAWENKRLLVLQFLANGVTTHIPLPKRVFADEEDQQRFLQRLQEAAKADNGMSPEADDRLREDAGVPDMQYEYWMSPVGRAHMQAALARFRMRQKKWGLPYRVRYVMVWIPVLVILALCFDWMIFWIFAAMAVIVPFIQRERLSEQTLLRNAQNGKTKNIYPVRWEFQLYPEELVSTIDGVTTYYSWSDLKGLVKMGDQYLFYQEKGSFIGVLPQAVLADSEEQFVQYCKERGMRLEQISCRLMAVDPREYKIPKEYEIPREYELHGEDGIPRGGRFSGEYDLVRERGELESTVRAGKEEGHRSEDQWQGTEQRPSRPDGSKAFLIVVVSLLVGGLVFAILQMMIDAYIGKNRKIEMSKNAREYLENGAYGEDIREEDYVFDPADYPEYMPLEQQKEILEALDIPVSEEILDELRTWMEESEYGDPFVSGRGILV